MKKMKQSVVMLLMAFAISSTVFVACNNEEEYSDGNTQRKSGLSKTENFISFKDFDDMNTNIDLLREMDDEAIELWETSKNFVSLQTIFNMVNDAEDKHYDTLEMRYKSYEEIKEEELHSELFNEFSDILIKRNTPDDDGFYYDMDIDNSDYAYIVNKDGIVKIGKDIYQFKDGITKVIKGGDKSKISILNRIDSTDEQLGIFVYKIKLISTENAFHKHITKNKGKYRVILYHDFFQNYTYDYTKVCTAQKTKVRSLKKRLFGAYYIDHRAKITVNSTFNGNTVYGYTKNTITMAVDYMYRNWSVTNHQKVFKKNSTATFYYFDSDYKLFFSVDKPKIYNGTISVSTSDGVSLSTVIP